MRKKKNRRNNRGYTLVELLIAIAILSIVVGAVIGFFMYTMRFYHRGNAESDLQNEAQLTMSQLETLVVNASQGVGLDPSLPSSQTTGSEMFVYNRLVSNSGSVSYQVTHIYTDNKKLKYCYMDYSIDPLSGAYALSSDKVNPQTLSDYVENFSVDVSNLLSSNRIRFSIDFRAGGNRTYKTSNTVLLRNKVLELTSGNAGDYFKDSILEDEKNKIKKLELSPDEFAMWAGTSAANPFTPTYKKEDNSVTDKGTAVWTFDPQPQGKADINRSTGTINLGVDVRGDVTVRATEQGSINRGGLDNSKYVSDTAVIHVKSAEAVASLTKPAQKPDKLSVATAVFTIYGQNLTPEDLHAITPTVMAESSTLSVSITPDEAGSDFVSDVNKLCYTVNVTRPGNYIGKTYKLRIHAMVPGNVECKSGEVTWNFLASPGDEDKTVSEVRLVDSSGAVNCSGGSVSVAANRGDSYTLIMQVKYKDKNGVETDFMPLPADSWGITQSGGNSSDSSIVAGASDYTVYMGSQDYKKDYSIDFTTRYSTGNGGEANGPSIHFTFSRVKFAVQNVLGDQNIFPVTSGQTTYIQFEVQGLKNANVYVKSGSGSGLSITSNGTMASVTATKNAMMDTEYTFGLKDSKGHVLDGVTCSLTIWPDQANTASYNGGQTDDAVYIPSFTDISNIDPSKTAPETGKSTTLFMPDGEKITYINSSKNGVDGSTHKYWAEYKGKTYYYIQTAKQWRLNEK